jgi:hypothetical protein
MSSSNSVKNELRKIEQEIAKISKQEKRRQQDLIRYQKKRASDHRRTKKRISEAQKNVNRGTRKNRPVLKAPSSPVDEPYTMDQDIIQKYLEQNVNLQNIKQTLDQTSQRMIQMDSQPIPQNMSSSQRNQRSAQRKSMKDTHTKNLKHFTKLIDKLDEPLGTIKEIYPEALQDHVIFERYDPKYAVPSNFTGSPTISEGEFDSLSPPNYMQNMPSLTGFKLTAENLANMERGNEMNLARQIRDSQARDSGLQLTAQDEIDIEEELAQMFRDAEGNRKRRTRRKHKKKKKKTHKKKQSHKKKKTHKKKKKRRKKKGGTRKNRRR